MRDLPIISISYSTVLLALTSALGCDQGAHGSPFIPHELATWLPIHYFLFFASVLTFSEVLNQVCFFLCDHVACLPTIPEVGKHYDHLTLRDRLYILYNKMMSGCWLLFILMGDVRHLTLANTVVAGTLFFIGHDLLWAPLHRLFHSNLTLYRAIHKFHHKQFAPSRGINDALFNNPIEATIGLFIHCWAVWVVLTFLCPMHIYTLRFLVPLAQVQAFVQHCRYDLRSPIRGIWFDSWKHDLHHHDPTCNYSSYTSVIDRAMGTLRHPRYTPNPVDAKERQQ